MRFRIRTLLFGAFGLLVVWYLAGGRTEISWWVVVHRATRSGWDLSQADRYPHYGLLYYASALGALILFVICAIRTVGEVVQRKLKVVDDKPSKAN
jgi:hypothetical protein